MYIGLSVNEIKDIGISEVKMKNIVISIGKKEKFRMLETFYGEYYYEVIILCLILKSLLNTLSYFDTIDMTSQHRCPSSNKGLCIELKKMI